MKCAVTHDLNQHLADVEKDEIDAAWIESKQQTVTDELISMSPVSAQRYFETLSSWDFREWMFENFDTDGVFEYFVEHNNNHARIAIEAMVGGIDFDALLEKAKTQYEIEIAEAKMEIDNA